MMIASINTTRRHQRTLRPSQLWPLLLVVVGASLCLVLVESAFQSTQQIQQQQQQRLFANSAASTTMEDDSIRQQELLGLSSKTPHNIPDITRRRRRRCHPCDASSSVVVDAKQDNNEDLDLDRREATFALLGMLWAVTGGTTSSNLLLTLLGNNAGGVAHAAYGDDAKIVLPNPLENIIQRSTQGCLVESLGNRECLVYGTSDDKVYQGADGQVLVQRLQQAAVALATIPDLIQSKKWLAINGVLTGPMGTLIATMNQLIQLRQEQQQQQQQEDASSNNNIDKKATTAAGVAAATQLAQKVKQDIFAIGAAADRKQGDVALQSQQKAVADLVAFLKALE